ncbi:MAG: hypothetical protein P4L51_01020 [Puia sp.]|nr:hypothetical protein [Puia sp.]
MLRYYCKLAWRYLKKNSQFSILNLLGLSTGLACVWLIGLWVGDEYAMDHGFDKGPRLYQVMQNIRLGDGGIQTIDHTPGILAQALAAEMPEVEQATVIRFPARMENPAGILSATGIGTATGNNSASRSSPASGDGSANGSDPKGHGGSGTHGDTASGEAPSNSKSGINPTVAGTGDLTLIKARELYVTRNFFNTFSFRLLQGDPDRVFSDEYGVVLSEETALKLFHTTKGVLGRPVSWDRGQGGFYKAYNHGLPFEYRFLDEDFRDLYASEQRVAVLSRYFATVAILISCLGLFGLAVYTARKRQKEIAIRKVVGASASQIAAMLSTDFLKWVAIACCIGFPVAGWALGVWLDHFAYRVSIGAGLFVLAGAAVLLITLLTIGYQSVKAATANPVGALRE